MAQQSHSVHSGSYQPNPQQVQQSSFQKNAIDFLIRDHQSIAETFQQILNTNDPDKKIELAQQAIRLTVIHAMTEETELYPKFPKMFNDGDALRSHTIEDHRSLDRVLVQLEKTDPNDAQFDTYVREAISKFSQHRQEEESDIFPKVREHMTHEELAKLQDKMETVRNLVPTHPHPDAPDRMRSSKIAGSMVGMIDRMKDMFTKASQNARGV